MTFSELKNLQSPLKEKYRTDRPVSAVITLKAEGTIVQGISCSLQTGAALVEDGLHPATGGSGLQACSCDMLLQSLVACAGVTLQAVATAINVTVERDARALGKLDFKEHGCRKDAVLAFNPFSSNLISSPPLLPKKLKTSPSLPNTIA